jgi:serine/threonine-protein kinase
MDSNPPSPYRVPPGTQLNGIYEVDSMIGSGGMGEVYKGHEIQTGSSVAIKMLLPDMAGNEAAIALFRKEASALHYLVHDAIVRYFVFTIEPTLQRPYLAMEFVDGRSLSEIFADGPLAYDDFLRLMRRVASGLEAAHQRGIIHRDVSPDNIIVPQGDLSRAKIIDFGIARSNLVGDATVIGVGFAGKHNYVSPEQVGLFGGDDTARSDIYSLALVLFQALTGRKLDMGGSQFQLVEKRRSVPDLTDVDIRLRPLLERMLQPDPALRLASMAEIEHWTVDAPAALQSSPARNGTGSTDHLRISAPKPAPRRSRSVLAMACAVVLATAAGAYYQFFWRVPQPAATGPAAPTLQPAKAPATAPPPSPLPFQPSQPAEEKSDRTDAIRSFVDKYDGGDCFFVMPVAISSDAAVLEGLGSTTTPFELLDNTFSKTQGFEASIGVRQVTPSQCPAVTFLNRIRADRDRAPRIWVGSVKLKSGETLSGRVENLRGRVVELLLISDAGQIQNLSSQLNSVNDAASFSIVMRRSDGGSGAAPQLIIALASQGALQSLRQTTPVAADQLFAQTLAEAQRNGMNISASARYIKLEQ